MHTEHLLVFYSVELFFKACMEIHQSDAPISDEKLELFYRHFEEATPPFDKFEKYAEGDALFKFSASRKRLPFIN